MSHRRMDHLVIAVRDLDAAGDFYRRLGFQVGARNRHPWGTENRLIQFGSSFLELITVADPAMIPPHAPGRFSFGAFVRDYLARREGCAMVVLDSTDAQADAADFAAKGIGCFEPFFFERIGRRPDGGETRVAFTLAFAMQPGLPDAAFFVCQQHCPENFWNPAFQTHPSGATGIRSIVLSVPEPSDHVRFLSGFTGTPGAVRGADMAFPLRDGADLLVQAAPGAGGFSGFSIAVPDLAVAGRCLRDARMRCEAAPGHIALSAADAFGVTIRLVGAGQP